MKEKILNNKDDYKLVLNNFEGPLDLLIHLINKNKMSIFDISLSEITDQYIEYLDNMNKLNLEVTSDFLVMASTLVNIKSKKLLPEINNESEEDDISEEELLNRIVVYKKYKEISKVIATMYLKNFGTFIKGKENIIINNNGYEGEKININNLSNVYNKILDRNILKINREAGNVNKLALYEKYTVKDKTKQIVNYLNINNEFEFNKLFNVADKPKLEIVTAFLSTLELGKLKQVDIIQDNLFSEINVFKNFSDDYANNLNFYNFE